MVHRTFKGSVSKMNRKNIELDLIRRHNTLQTIRYLIDGGKDNRFPNIGQGFLNLTKDLLLYPILSNWYMTQDFQKEDITDNSKYNYHSNYLINNCIYFINNNEFFF